MRKIRTWQLCRAGKFGADGAEITVKDLQDITETFCPPRPISIGHDMARKDNFPKFGDVLTVELSEDKKTLIGQTVLHPQLESQYDDGLYKGWSVTIPRRAVDGKRYLHSLAICGAVPPKIPGLQELMIKCEYNEGDAVEVVNFADKIDYQEAPSMTEDERKKMEALEAENKKLKEDAEKKEQEKKKNYSDEPTEKDPTKTPEYAKLQEQVEALKASGKIARIKGITDKFGDRLTAAAMSKITAIADKLADAAECEFSDNDKTEKKSALDVFADLIDNIIAAKPDVIKARFDPSQDFSDKGSGDKSTDWNKLDSKL